jgi:hypothetical protein
VLRPWLAAVSLSCSACPPLIATIGHEDGTGDTISDAALSDVAAPPPDASNVHDALAPEDAAREAAATKDAGTMLDEPCVLLPDVVNAHARDTAILTVDTGVVTGKLDQALGCSSVMANAVTYTRNDGAPLVRAGQAYMASWAAGPGGSATAFALNTTCEQPLFGNLATWYYIFLTPMCGPLTVVNVDSTLVRLVLSNPSPFPEGLKLCRATCP